MALTLETIQQAQARLAPHLSPTPVEPVPALGTDVWLKLENTNRTHSFKVRGALNAALCLDDAARARGIVTASSGNHAQGVAYAARHIGVPARIVMPVTTPARKVNGVRLYGGTPIMHGDTYHEAEVEARRLEAAEGLTYISPYNDEHVAAGQGTIGLEILAQVPDVARVLVCIGGGGLISGVATAVKALRPDVEIIGVCAEAAPAMYNFFYDRRVPFIQPTLADALGGEIESGSLTFDVVRRHVDRIVLVDEAQIAEAIRWSVLDGGWVVEGGGAVGIAALRANGVPDDGRRTVVTVSGGNIDGVKLRGLLA